MNSTTMEGFRSVAHTSKSDVKGRESDLFNQINPLTKKLFQHLENSYTKRNTEISVPQIIESKNGMDILNMSQDPARMRNDSMRDTTKTAAALYSSSKLV